MGLHVPLSQRHRVLFSFLAIITLHFTTKGYHQTISLRARIFITSIIRPEITAVAFSSNYAKNIITQIG